MGFLREDGRRRARAMGVGGEARQVMPNIT
jgi:hypothetical protein